MDISWTREIFWATNYIIRGKGTEPLHIRNRMVKTLDPSDWDTKYWTPNHRHVEGKGSHLVNSAPIGVSFTFDLPKVTKVELLGLFALLLPLPCALGHSYNHNKEKRGEHRGDNDFSCSYSLGN